MEWRGAERSIRSDTAHFTPGVADLSYSMTSLTVLAQNMIFLFIYLFYSNGPDGADIKKHFQVLATNF